MNDSRPTNWGATIYRQCRLWHGYLSAVSFLALLFFAGTGLALNHPEWTKAPMVTVDRTLTLAPADVAAIRGAADRGAALMAIVARQASLRGFAKDAQLDGDNIFVRLQGANGSSDLRADLAAGQVDVSVEQADAVGVLNALHRGTVAGGPWRMAIDVIAITLIVMSLLGFGLFIFMRQRIVTALMLVVASIVGAASLYLFAVR
jgi:uncharacterized protein